MNKVMRKMTINNLKVGDEIRWLKTQQILTIKRFSPCSEEWCKTAGKTHHYKECERVRVLGTVGNSNYVLCCKDIEVVKKENTV